MMYKIDKNASSPAYIQLYRRLKEDIVNEIYSYGSKLPSKRVMAAETGLSIITIEHTYELLCDEGYVESRDRSGFYVVFRAADGFAGVRRYQEQKRVGAGLFVEGQGAVRTGVSAEDLEDIRISSHSESRKSVQEEYHFPFSVLTKTMRRVMNDYGEAILNKSPNEGSPVLREAIRNYLARNRDIHVEKEQIVIGSGAEYLYSMIIGLLGREKLYALEYPSYEQIERVYKMAGVSYEFLPLGADGIESTALQKTRAAVLHISPYRSYPTGITASASKRYEYIRWSEQPEHYIVEDDFESEFSVSSKPEETMFSLSKQDNVIYLNTFSKTISPSLRIGYMVIPKQLVERYSERLGFYSCTVPTFEQFVLAELLASGDFERHINRVRRMKRRG